MKGIMENEKRTIKAMVELYCKGRHGEAALCGECAELLVYAGVRLDKCPFKEEKPACAKCPVHCYNPGMRERVSSVMRYSGPRMMLRHPLLAIRHVVRANKKGKVKKGAE